MSAKAAAPSPPTSPAPPVPKSAPPPVPKSDPPKSGAPKPDAGKPAAVDTTKAVPEPKDKAPAPPAPAADKPPVKQEDKENKTPAPPPPPPATKAAAPSKDEAAESGSESDPYNYDVSDTSEDESDHKPPPMIDMGIDLDKLEKRIARVTAPPPVQPKQDRQKLTDIDKDKYSKFKTQFEQPLGDKNDDYEKKQAEKRILLEAELQPGGKEQMSKFKNKFEKLQTGTDEKAERKKELVHQTANDRKRIMKLMKKKREVVDEVPKNCAICDKPVYPVEKIFVLKQTWHKQCFKCATCHKQLTVYNYNHFEGKLYCKLHLMETMHPELIGKMDEAETQDVDRDDPQAEDLSSDEEFAVSSKPKTLDKSVVKSGLKPSNDLDTLPSLTSVKNRWQQNATDDNDEGKVKRRSNVEPDMFPSGAVKQKMNKFAEGGSGSEEESEESGDEAEEDENGVVRFRKQRREKLCFETKSLASKWEKGEVEKSGGEKVNRSSELTELSGKSVKDRFKERKDGEEEPLTERSSKNIDIDTSNDQENPKQAFLRFLRYRRFIPTDMPVNAPADPVLKQELDELSTNHVSAEAMKRFKEGKAWESKKQEKEKEQVRFNELGNYKEKFEKGPEDAHAVHKTEVEARCHELGNIKDAFESGKVRNSEEEKLARAHEQRQASVQREFEWIKAQQRKSELCQQRQLLEQDACSPEPLPDNQQPQEKFHEKIRGNPELGNIKDRFEKGEAYTSNVEKSSDADIEIKRARKARQKFQRYASEHEGEPVIQPKTSTSKAPVRRTDSGKVVPEPVNKRVISDDSDEDFEEAFEVRDLASKFSNLGKDEPAADKKPKPKRQFTPPPEGYVAEIVSEAKTRDPNIVSEDATPSYRPAAVDAKNLKAKFEQRADESDEVYAARKKQLEAEFEAYKAAKGSQPAEPADGGSHSDEERREAARRAELEAIGNRDHAGKMAKKFEKIQAKEAKKASKSAPKRNSVLNIPAVVCFVCERRVYFAEQKEVEGRTLHSTCFKCVCCSIRLRAETYALGKDDQIYCVNHHKQMFNNMAKPVYQGQQGFNMPLCA